MILDQKLFNFFLKQCVPNSQQIPQTSKRNMTLCFQRKNLNDVNNNVH